MNGNVGTETTLKQDLEQSNSTSSPVTGNKMFNPELAMERHSSLDLIGKSFHLQEKLISTNELNPPQFNTNGEYELMKENINLKDENIAALKMNKERTQIEEGKGSESSIDLSKEDQKDANEKTWKGLNSNSNN